MRSSSPSWALHCKCYLAQQRRTKHHIAQFRHRSWHTTMIKHANTGSRPFSCDQLPWGIKHPQCILQHHLAAALVPTPHGRYLHIFCLTWPAGKRQPRPRTAPCHTRNTHFGHTKAPVRLQVSVQDSPSCPVIHAPEATCKHTCHRRALLSSLKPFMTFHVSSGKLGQIPKTWPS